MVSFAAHRQTALSVVATLVIALAIGSIFYRRAQRASEGNLAPYRGMGEAVAHETAKALAGAGEVVVLTTAQGGAGAAAAIQTLKQSGAETGGISVKAVEEVDVDAPPATMEEINALLEKRGGAGALVAFPGTIDLEGLRQQNPSAEPARLVIVADGTTGIKELLEKRLISSAVVPRFRVPPGGMPPPRTPREWFDNYYEVLTAADIPDLPE